MYKCDTCDKVLSSLERLNYHLSRKVCQKPSRICPLCGKIFKSKQSCQYHISQNVCTKRKPKLTIKHPPEKMSQQELIEALAQTKEKLLEATIEIKTLKEHPQTVNNILLFPHQFGQEDMNHVKNKLGDFLSKMIKVPEQSIPKLFDTIHNNDKLPEYHNVYVPNERSSYAMVSDGKTFTYKPKKTIIDQIIEDKRSILNQYVDKNAYQFGDNVLTKYDQYQDLLDANSQCRKDLELEIGGLLLNMKSVIAQDEKTRRLLERVDQGDFQLPSNMD